MLRILAGSYRSRVLQTPPGDNLTRPYPQRVKEAVFNLLRGWFEDARVLDLFAGVGTMGLEAVSRGAARVTMVERERQVLELLERNVASLGCGDRVDIVAGDALGPLAIASAPDPVDIVFIDPPYAMLEDVRARSRVFDQVRRLGAVMNPKGFVVLRSPIAPENGSFDITGVDGPEVHDYGGRGMWVLLYQPGAPTSVEGS